jgi:hypothetical protein
MRHDIDLKTEEECKTYEEASALLGKLLEDLKTQNMLRQTAREEKRRFLSILWNTWEFQGAFNEMTRQYDPQNFDSFVAKTGLTRRTLVCAFVSQILGNLLICYESLIKLPLVFFLDEKCGVTKTTTLGKLLPILEDISPSFAKGINKIMNKDFRNALAHGTYWLEKDGLHYAKNSYLEAEKTMPFDELKDEMRKASITGRAFVHVIREKAEQGYL